MRFSIEQTSGGKTPRIDCDEEGQVLKDFFEAEIQEDIAYAAYLLDRLHASDAHPFELDGNQYEISFSNVRFTIENLFDEDETCAGDLPFLAHILEQWIGAMSQK